MFLSVEFLLLAIGLVAFRIVDFSGALIGKILKNVKMFLPITKQDCINQQQKQLEMKTSQTNVTTIRSCYVEEYIEKKRDDENLLKSEFLLILILLTLLTNIGMLIDSIISGSQNEFNISSSLSIILIGYLIYSGIYMTLRKKSTYEIKVIIFIFLLTLIPLCAVLYLNEQNIVETPQIIKFNYSSVCNGLKTRLERITKTTEENINYNINLNCDYWKIKAFLISTFSIMIAVLFRTTANNAYFDYIITSKEDNCQNIRMIYEYILTSNHGKEKTFTSSFIFNNLKTIVRIKLILCIVIFIMLIDFISFSEIESILPIDERTYFYFLSIMIAIEFIINLLIQRYYAILMFNSIFPDINQFKFKSNDKDDYELKRLRIIVETHNSSYWHVFNSNIILCFLPLIAYLTFVNRSQITIFYNDNNFEFKKYFLESFFYIIMLSAYFCKGAIAYLYIFYNSFISSGSRYII